MKVFLAMVAICFGPGFAVQGWYSATLTIATQRIAERHHVTFARAQRQVDDEAFTAQRTKLDAADAILDRLDRRP